MTGFDNRHLLTGLQTKRKQTREIIGKLDEESRVLARAETDCSQKLILIEQLESLDFTKIDIAGTERDLNEQTQRLAELTRPDSDAANAKSRYDAANEELKTIRSEIKILTEAHGACKNELKSASDALNRARARCGDGLLEDDITLAQKQFPLTDIQHAHQLSDAERTANHTIDQKIQRAEEQKAEAEKRLIRFMGNAKAADTGALSDVGTELRDLEAYLNRLQTLEEESLPEKLKSA
jgi:uncharacterized protein YPO0396